MRRQRTTRWNNQSTLQPLLIGLCTPVVLMMFGLDVRGMAQSALAQDNGRHSLIKPSAGTEPRLGKSVEAVTTELPTTKGKQQEQRKANRKSRWLIGKPTEPITKKSAAMSRQENASPMRAETESDSETKGKEKKKAPATMGVASAGSGLSGTGIAPLGAVSAVSPIAASSPSTAAAAPGTSTIAVVGAGTPANAGGRGIQKLIQQVPGLAQLLVGAGPVIPQEPIASLPPPLLPPQSGLPAAPVNWLAYHVVNRLAYGGTPNQLNLVASLKTEAEARSWATAFMKEQLELDPTKPWPTNLHSTSSLPVPIMTQDIATDLLLSQDKSDWRADSSDSSVLSPNFSELQDHDLIRKMHSRRQLKEKMVYFWENHFNTNYRTHNKGQYELQENEAFRARAFGNFLDLLMASGKSAAMMIYLNTDVNVKENPNENYAREVLELHTLGVTDQGTSNGYTQADIVEAAKAFTGWDNTPDVRGGFRFVASRHSPGSKLVLGQSIPFNSSGPSEGEQVLTLAARHPSTARHLAKKLCEYFVSDAPSTVLVNEVTSVFTDSNGDIKKVLIAIFTSPDFNNVASYRSQVKTPLEFVVGLYRNLGVWSSRDPFRNRLVTTGQSIYEFPPPTGFKEEGIEWLNTSVLFNEASMAYEITISGFGSSIMFGSPSSAGSIRLWMDELGLTTEEQILGFLTNMTVDRVVTTTEYQVYLDTIRAGLGGSPFNIKNSSRETALDRTLATMLTNPRYLYQ